MASEIVVCHVGGGSDEFGPIEKVKNAGFPLRTITLEALDGQCIADGPGESDFYVNKHPLSSGLFPPNPLYAPETFDKSGLTWGENTEVDHVLKLKTTSIDAALTEQPDVISLDIQGGELAALRGADRTLKGALCVVAEVEFAPIYLGQPLFHEQMALLLPYGFRLMELFSVQAWHQGPKFGLGFLTVAEAVWLRFDPENLSAQQVEKLAMIAAGFGRYSFCLRLLERLDGRIENEWLKSLWMFRDSEELRNCAS